MSKADMQEQNDTNDEILSAQKAAEQLFNSKGLQSPSVYEPQCPQTARAAVHRLEELFENLPGSVSNALEAAGSSGELLSSDRLQGLAEILQNADDADASEVRLLLRDGDLLITHNGSRIRLQHVLGLTMPWFSTKRAESQTFGRFGIGLSALRSISEGIDVHCSPYHVRLGEPALSPIDPPRFPSGFDEEGWTVFRVLLTEDGVAPDELAQWIDRWGDAGLLFLRNVAEVALRGPKGDTIRRLSVCRDVAKLIHSTDSIVRPQIYRQHVNATDGRSWMVYSAEIPTPTDVSRVHKKIEPTTPVGVALPLHRTGTGQIYAGLPVVNTPLPVFLNAQFDPLTSRRDLADTPWNRALVPLVADVWSHAVVNLFRLKPTAAWPAIPIRSGPNGEEMPSLVERLGVTIIDSARQSVAMRVRVEVDGKGWFSLAQLAVEARPLEGVVTEEETAMLLGMSATIPTTLRDAEGKWRAVLDDWREAGADFPKPLSVEHALELLQDTNRPVQSTIALVATGVRDKLEDRLLGLPCLVASDERRLVPPPTDSPEAVALEISPLARELGIVTALHTQYLEETDDAHEIINWLRKRGALLDGTDDRVVVHRLASAGRSGRRITVPLTDRQVDALRRAFELLDHVERRELGRDVGRAIVLSAYVYELRGGRKRRREVFASPMEAHLPGSIDRGKDSFAVAADKSTDVVWLSPHYRALKSSVGRAGIGAQRLLTLLGAETAPRPRVHPGLEERYIDPQRGLHAKCETSPSNRTQVMKDRDATYTLQDWDCPDLTAVVRDIARVRQARKRRTRARALLATMGRAWERLSDFAEVESAKDYRMWIKKGAMPAFWLWQVRDIAWLDDESGTPRRPSELRIRTPGTEAIYGQDSPDFVHPDIDNSSQERRNWRAAMAAFGVSGDPTRQELIIRLKELRSEAESGSLSNEYVARDTAIIYKALAESCKDSATHADLRDIDLRREFQRGGLICTDLGWRPPEEVFAGPSVFGQYKAFAPPVPDTEPLWSMLQLKTPLLSDCIDVLRKIARHRLPPDVHDESIQIQTLRLLVEQLPLTSVSSQDRRKLTKLLLWTSQGWENDRPIFATDDDLLADGLRHLLPLWQPGGELDQFRSLLKPLRVEEILSSSANVIEPEHAHDDPDLTHLFRATIQLLQEDFARNEPHLAESLSIGWDTLAEFRVQEHPNLALSVHVQGNRGDGVLHCAAPVRVDPELQIVFVKEPQNDLSRADRGGRAIATLFHCDRRRVAQAWRAAWDLAENGRTAKPIELANQKDKRKQQQIKADIDRKLEALQAQTGRNRRSTGKTVRRGLSASNERIPVDGERMGGTSKLKPRVLVDPESLRVINPAGRVVGSSATGSPSQHRVSVLVEPRARPQIPQNRVPLRRYSALDRENIGLELARKVLSSDREDIVDLRTQCGVGADAMDKLERFYELKVSAGNEPNYVTLTNSELQRARNSPHFFLVVVSGVEGADARPTVRIIPRPLDQLEQAIGGTMTLSGIRNAKSVTYDFAPLDEPVAMADPDGPVR